MKVGHKRIPSGIENWSKFQNTERFQAPKKPKIQQQKRTAKKQKSNQQLFFKIIEDMGLYKMYHMFIEFHCEAQNIIRQGQKQEIWEHCQLFKEILCQEIKQQWRQQQDDQQQSETIKQLLEEIYNLRRKLCDLDQSLNIQSISSLDQNIKCTTIYEKSQSKSRSNYGLSHIPNSIQNKLKDIQIVPEQQVDKQDFQRVIANFMEMKVMIFELLSLNWRLIRIHIPDQAKLMFQTLGNVYRNEINNVIEYDQNNVASTLLDSFSTIIFISRHCVQKILEQYNKKQQK